MDARNHALLNDLDTSHTEAHRAALAAWRDGPFAEWQKKLREAGPEDARAWTAANPQPTPPAQPLLPGTVVRNVAAMHGVTVDDLVRRARGTEVRTIYVPAEALDRASEALGEGIRAALLTLDWPELPTLPAPPSRPRPVEEPDVEQPPTERPS